MSSDRRFPEKAMRRLNRQVAQLYRQGRYAQAVELAVQARDSALQYLGEGHPDYAASLHNLAILYQAMGNYAAAEPLYQQAREIGRVALGEDHPNYATNLNNLAGLFIATGRATRAFPLMEQAVHIIDLLTGQVFSFGSESQ